MPTRWQLQAGTAVAAGSTSHMELGHVQVAAMTSASGAAAGQTKAPMRRTKTDCIFSELRVRSSSLIFISNPPALVGTPRQIVLLQRLKGVFPFR